MKVKIGLILCLYLFTQSCNIPDHYFSEKPECHNINNIFKESLPNSDVYQENVMSVLAKSSSKDFRYFFETFKGESKDYMVVNFRNDNYCFYGEVFVTDWSKLAGMRKANGKSYPKELYNLQWKIKSINGKEEIFYVDMHRIID